MCGRERQKKTSAVVCAVSTHGKPFASVCSISQSRACICCNACKCNVGEPETADWEKTLVNLEEIVFDKT